MAAELAAGSTGILDGISLYHMVLEGAVFTAGQRALLDDLEDDVLPGVREGVGRVELDERWHVGFGVRCLTEAADPEILLDDVLARATEAAAAWGDAVPRRHAGVRGEPVPSPADGRWHGRGAAGGLTGQAGLYSRPKTSLAPVGIQLRTV